MNEEEINKEREMNKKINKMNE